MNNVKQLIKFDEETARVDNIIYLAPCLQESACPSFEELIENGIHSKTELLDLFAHADDSLIDAWSVGDTDSVVEWMIISKTLGFCVEFATPSMIPGDISGFHYHWGCFYTKWVYGDTLKEAFDKGFSWVKQMREKDSKKEATK